VRVTVVEDGQLKTREVPLRNALNEVLRGEYVKDCEKGLARWNKVLADEGRASVSTCHIRVSIVTSASLRVTCLVSKAT
jgi:hypothetical protein